ncbi:uncharacterized protein LOC107367475 [Tetranychus urticae]|nr:uncharacterized protein LOC107367475 [Tetranychus urticae]
MSMNFLNKLITSKKKTSKTDNIVVVNNVPTSSPQSSTLKTTHFNLPFTPLIPDNVLSTGLLQLDPQPLSDFGLTIEDYLRKKVETVSRNQYKICEIIKETESTSIFLSNYLDAKDKRLKKVEESFDKVQELLNKCESSLESCLTNIDNLNRSLPPHLKLENLEYNKKLETSD